MCYLFNHNHWSDFTPDLLKSFGVGGYLISLIIIGLLIGSFEYAFQGRFMGLIYPGEVENDDESENPPQRNHRFVQGNEN